jgi:hypothetical protein
MKRMVTRKARPTTRQQGRGPARPRASFAERLQRAWDQGPEHAVQLAIDTMRNDRKPIRERMDAAHWLSDHRWGPPQEPYTSRVQVRAPAGERRGTA